MNQAESRRDLLLRYLDGNVTPEEKGQVAEALRSDPEVRAFLRQVAEHAVSVAVLERGDKVRGTETTVDFPAPEVHRPAGSTGETETLDYEKGRSPAADFSVGTTISMPPRRERAMDESSPKAGLQDSIAPADYEILERLGKGGMGVVYKARHLPLNRVVAIKMILAGKHASPESLARFRHEAEAAAHLSHPNIVSVYEVGEFQGMPYFSLEFVDGEAMSASLLQASLTVQRAAELMEQVARAVHYSHERGVVHRDLKPSNILITQDGVPKVADFGLARRLGDDYQEHTLTGEIVGTPGFMAPEQARGDRSIGPSTDVYALGAILYTALTGRAPFVGPTPIDTIQQVVSNDPVPPSRLQPNVDRDLETICMKCLEKDPQRRYGSAAELADDLQRFLDNKPIVARPVTRLERLKKWCKRNPRVAALSSLAASLAVVLLAGGYVSAAVISRQKTAEEVARKKAEISEELALDQQELALEANRLVLYQTQEFFKGKPQLSDLRRELLTLISGKIQQLYDTRYEYDVKEIFRASALRQLGQIDYDLGDKEQALKKFLESEAIARRLIAQGALPRPEMNLSNLDLAIGDAERDLGNLEVARDRYLSMIEHRKKYFGDKEWFMAEQSLAEADGRLGDVYRRLGEYALARPLLENSLEARRKWHKLAPNRVEPMAELAGALGVMSSLYQAMGDLDATNKANDEALVLLAKLAMHNSDYANVRNLAVRLRARGQQSLISRSNDAGEYLEQAVDAFDQLLLEHAGNKDLQEHAAKAHYLLGAYLAGIGQPAENNFDRAIELQRPLSEASPENVRLAGTLLMSLARAGRFEEAIGMADRFAEKQDSAYHCAFSSLAYGFLWNHPQTDPELRDDLAAKAVAQTRRFIQLGTHDFKLLRGETDFDFAALQPIPGYREMLDEEEARLAKANAGAAK
jgi:eukaryotic-like serine/threonine-protein kinase